MWPFVTVNGRITSPIKKREEKKNPFFSLSLSPWMEYYFFFIAFNFSFFFQYFHGGRDVTG